MTILDRARPVRFRAALRTFRSHTRRAYFSKPGSWRTIADENDSRKILMARGIKPLGS